MRRHVKEAAKLAEDIQAGLDASWSLAPDKEAVEHADATTARLMHKNAQIIVMALRYYARRRTSQES